MRLTDVLYYMILGIPNALFYILTWTRLSKRPMRYNPILSIIITIGLSMGLSIIHNFGDSLLRIILIIIFLIIACKIIIKSSFKESILLGFTSLSILMIGELIFSLLYMIFMNFESLNILDSKVMALLINIIISLIGFGISLIPFINKMYQKLEKFLPKVNNLYILSFTILILFSVNFLFVTSYYDIDIRLLIIINALISAVYLIIVFRVFNIQNKYIKISNKYNTTLTSLKEYEEILDKYKIMNHENKNDLLMIRNMILKNENDVDKYIDKLIDIKIKDDEKSMYETSIIPSGGLRAVIYSKLLVMKDKKINSKLLVDKTVRSVDLNDYSDDFVLDLCKVVSIYIDNAIEAAELTKKKEVLIELFLNSKDEFNISVTNTYKGTIDLSKIDAKGYTTKGTGHGYGLSLAREILDKYTYMQNTRKVNKTTFTQNIIIKNKN